MTPEKADKSGLPLRESGVPCEFCGSTKRRPNINRCAGCGRFAPDPIYSYSELTDTWYRVWDYEHLGDGKIQAREKEQVSREDVPERWLEGIEDA